MLFENHKTNHWLYNQKLEADAPTMQTGMLILCLMIKLQGGHQPLPRRPRDGPNMSQYGPEFDPSSSQDSDFAAQS